MGSVSKASMRSLFAFSDVSFILLPIVKLLDMCGSGISDGMGQCDGGPNVECESGEALRSKLCVTFLSADTTVWFAIGKGGRTMDGKQRAMSYLFEGSFGNVFSVLITDGSFSIGNGGGGASGGDVDGSGGGGGVGILETSIIIS